MEDPVIHIVDDEDEEYPALARLIELGRQKSYVTIDDICISSQKLNRMWSNWKKPLLP